MINYFWLPLHVFSAVCYGGIVFGGLIQNILTRNKKEIDYAVIISMLSLGLPCGIITCATAFILTSVLNIFKHHFVLYGIEFLCSSLIFSLFSVLSSLFVYKKI